MPEPAIHLAEIELALVSSPIVVEYQIIRFWANTDDGYVRIRATLYNGDFVEMAEYFVIERDDVEIVDYRHQWMDGQRKQLRRRWDNTPHHPELENAPHHCHVGGELLVEPSHPLDIVKALALIEIELGATASDPV